ncbi:MAG: hypothetical protein FWD64_02925 [Acidobacteriaceae bacterium]|nr:hypothetical protein [Acidobacteriaceae bacterium]
MKVPRLRIAFIAAVAVLAAIPLSVSAQDEHVRHGRKYKPLPETSHIQVVVTKKSNGKPILNAGVVFVASTKEGKNLGSYEVKSGLEGKAVIDIIPRGSIVRVQVIANGFATFAQDYTVDEPSREIAVEMQSPREQVSAYEKNSGEESSRQPGVQEPVRPPTPPPATPASPETAPK